jgi:hypothetical protein
MHDAQIDYSVGNSSIEEDIDQSPYDPAAPQTAYGEGTAGERNVTTPEEVYVLASPTECQVGEGHLADIFPLQEKLYRLRPEVAARWGLKNAWTVGWELDEDETAGEDVEEGSMVFRQELVGED